MSKPMTKAQLAEQLAGKTGITKRVALNVLDELAAIAYQEAENTFTIPGIAKLSVVERKARMGRNPATGETIHIPARKVVKFKALKACSDGVLGNR